jgi:hypothetical protein
MTEAFLFLRDLFLLFCVSIESIVGLSPLKRLVNRAYHLTGTLWVFIWGTIVAICSAIATAYYVGAVLRWGVLGWLIAVAVVVFAILGVAWPFMCVRIIAPLRSFVKSLWRRYHEFNRNRGLKLRRSVAIDYLLVFAFACLAGAIGLKSAPAASLPHHVLTTGLVALLVGFVVGLEIVKGCRETVYSAVTMTSGLLVLEIVALATTASPLALRFLASLALPAFFMCLVLPDEVLPTLGEDETLANTE